MYSGVYGSDLININEDKNILSLFIPSTINIDNEVNNEFYIENSIKMLTNSFDINDLKFYTTKGSWYSDDLNKIIIEDIAIITIEVSKVTQKDISKLINIAKWIKREMSQEGVTININDALAIV